MPSEHGTAVPGRVGSSIGHVHFAKVGALRVLVDGHAKRVFKVAVIAITLWKLNPGRGGVARHDDLVRGEAGHVETVLARR